MNEVLRDKHFMWEYVVHEKNGVFYSEVEGIILDGSSSTKEAAAKYAKAHINFMHRG